MVRRHALVAMVALSLTGCSALSPAGPATPSETVTPLRVPTETAEPDLAPPPGVSGNGSVSPGALARAHRRALGNRSLTWTVEFVQRDREAGAVIDGVTKRLQVGSGGTYRLRTAGIANQSQTLYVDGTGTYVRTVINDASVTRRLENSIGYRNYLTTGRSLHRYLETADASVSRVRRRGRPYYRVLVTAPPPALADGHPKQTVHNYTATAYVTPEGLVRTLVVRYDYSLRSDRVAVSIRTGYDRVGRTTVERPDWAAEPARGATATDAAGTATAVDGRGNGTAAGER
ncbi:MAG: hypothetical protein ABEJ26_09610 [Halosimplex sp.]